MKTNKELLIGLRHITPEQSEEIVNLVREYIYFFDNLRYELSSEKVHKKIYFPAFSGGKKNRVKRGVHPKTLYTYLLWKKVEKVITGEDK